MKRILLVFAAFLCIADQSSAQLSGNYTINNTLSTTGTNYASFTAAINALNSLGVNPTTGATFNVSSGQTFNETPPVLTATGAASGPIVFVKSGASANPVIVPATAGTIALATTIANFGSSGDGVVRIAGGDYITFNGIDIGLNSGFTTSTQYYEYGYLLLRANATDACRNVTIKNATINMQPTVQNSIGVYASNLDVSGAAITATAVTGRAENLVIRKNTILNAYNGVALRGSADATAPYNMFDHFNALDSNSIQSYGGASTECYGVYMINADSTYVADNTMQSLSTAANTYGIRPAASTSASVFIYRNTISLISTSGGIYGIDNSAGSTAAGNTIDMSYNKVINCTAGGGGSVYGIRGAGSAANLIISNNEIANISNSGNGTTYLIYSIPSGSATISKVFKNHLHHVENTSAGNTTMYLHICNSALETHLYQNNIHDIINYGTNGTIYGRSNTANFYYYDNTVSRLYTPNTSNSDGIRPLELNTGSLNQKVFFNTIYLDASSSNANYGNTCLHIATSVNAEVRNNILVNRSVPGSSTGYVSAMKRSSATLTSYNDLSDNNCFYADTLLTRRVVYTDGTTNLNISGFKALVGPDRDSLSFYELPPFINVSTAPYNLNVTEEGTQCSNGGSPVTSPIAITTDNAGNLRGTTTPDIGAFELGTPLPVSYIKLQAESASTDVVLQWEVTGESKISGFYIERSDDSKRFERIGYVKSEEHEVQENRYVKIDAGALNLSKDLYYRINQIDQNGKSTYSSIVKVSKITGQASLSIWPNPFTNAPNLSVESIAEGDAVLMVTDIKGNKILQQTIAVQKGINTSKLQGFDSFASGIYFVKVTMGTQTISAKMVKQ